MPRTLQSCLAEVGRRWPGLPRAQKRIVAKWFQLLSKMEELPNQPGGVEKLQKALKLMAAAREKKQTHDKT
jgi:hypothetical protein